MPTLPEDLEQLLPDPLLPPESFTRPEVGLVYSRKRTFHLIFKGLAMGPVWLLLIGTVISTGLWHLPIRQFPFLDPVIRWLSLLLIDIPNPYLDWLLLGLGYILLIVTSSLCLVVTILVAGFLLGRVLMGWEPVALDLNGLYYVGPLGQCFTAWSQVYTVGSSSLFPIRLLLEEGGSISLRVPESDRDWLMQVIRQLIIYHQSKDLLGHFLR